MASLEPDRAPGQKAKSYNEDAYHENPFPMCLDPVCSSARILCVIYRCIGKLYQLLFDADADAAALPDPVLVAAGGAVE